MSIRRLAPTLAFSTVLCAAAALVSAGPNETGALRPDRPEQAEIEAGDVAFADLQVAGLRMFTTLFNRLDGYGDGPMDPANTLTPGGRPTLQGNGTFLRINGLDAQTCLECHSFVSAATSPPTLGIGGFGGANANAMIAPNDIDAAGLRDLSGRAHFNGRFANPPFLFGAGAVELLGLEMTADLQALRLHALANPDTDVDLITKGVDFGTLRANAGGDLDFSAVQGVDEDLVVKPFGRKGEFATVRDFDVAALQFHMGMQPTEVVGEGDADGDGIVREALPGDLTALSAFIATLERPFAERLGDAARRGFETFRAVGCADCHLPELTTQRRALPLRRPEVANDPFANAFLSIDLTRAPMAFEPVRRGGIRVPLFADLKRHDMGPGLAEDFHGASDQRNHEFTTARLWGVADTAPYLHDGRATTLGDAIRAHGGEAQGARDAFEALSDEREGELLAFLRSLRTPQTPAQAVVRRAQEQDREAARDRDCGKSGRSDKRERSEKSPCRTKSGRDQKSGWSGRKDRDRSGKSGKSGKGGRRG